MPDMETGTGPVRLLAALGPDTRNRGPCTQRIPITSDQTVDVVLSVLKGLK
jgi:hypothetical protein